MKWLVFCLAATYGGFASLSGNVAAVLYSIFIMLIVLLSK